MPSPIRSSPPKNKRPDWHPRRQTAPLEHRFNRRQAWVDGTDERQQTARLVGTRPHRWPRLINGPEELTRAQRRALVRHLRRAQYRGGPGTRAGQQKCGSISAAFWNTKILIFRWARLRREPGSDAGPAQERARPRTTLHECVADAFAALLV